MKFFKFMALLAVLFSSEAIPSLSAESTSVICSFRSPLSYTGKQWKITCENAPVYLARWENNEWRVLALFDGTGGKYQLEWEKAAPGLYTACDSFGRMSESLKIEAPR